MTDEELADVTGRNASPEVYRVVAELRALRDEVERLREDNKRLEEVARVAGKEATDYCGAWVKARDEVKRLKGERDDGYPEEWSLDRLRDCEEQNRALREALGRGLGIVRDILYDLQPTSGKKIGLVRLTRLADLLRAALGESGEEGE